MILLQSVLVTIDRHEWYAPPQLYTRDDCSGLWIAKPAFQPDSLILSSDIKDVGNLVGLSVSSTGKAPCVGHMYQDDHQELPDGITGMQAIPEDAADNASDGGVKKRKVEEDLSPDGYLFADSSLNDASETKPEKSSSMQGEVLMYSQGAGTATAVNASIAERVIEPTLVMFEVILYSCWCLR